MPEVFMKNLLEAGVHFGHQTHRWNPKMKPFIYGPRNGIYIIDLEKTVTLARTACDFLKNTTANGGKVLFVATKKQGQEIAKEAAKRAGMPFVTERWLGGMLTNFQTIRRGCTRLDELDRWEVDGTYQILPKKEVVQLERHRKKLMASLGGIREMKALPAALFIIDPENESIAVKEANRLGIPVVAVVDTNCNPDPIDYIIPGNDDAIRSVTYFLNLAADACLEGAAVFEQRLAQQQQTEKPAPVKSEAQAPEAPQPATAAAGPVVVKRPAIKNIPTEIDYRAEALVEEDEVATPAPTDTTETPES